MNNKSLSTIIKNLRNRKGLSQEQLAEESNISLRTVQRIEKGETIPRGDTLVKLSQALDVTPDELLEWDIIEDKGYVQLLNWSSISFIVQPLLGILIPLVMWIMKRGKVKFVDDSGKKIINFQITWTLTLYLLLIIGTIILGGGSSVNLNINLIDLILYIAIDPKIPALIFLLLYLYNILSILLNIRKCQKGLKNRYVPAIPFLK
jgi:transcriptional regulator with XRE-family HTH domain